LAGGLSTSPTSREGRARVVTARTVHGVYGAKERNFRELVREICEDARRLRAEKF
jgi:hypothetical protein